MATRGGVIWNTFKLRGFKQSGSVWWSGETDRLGVLDVGLLKTILQATPYITSIRPFSKLLLIGTG
jgi:hypothetical protein